jgi:MFS family permease
MSATEPSLKVISIQRVRKLPLWRPLGVRNFRLLWMGQAISIFGDQFYFIALPLLTLQLTGSAFSLGTVLMATGATRAVFELIGGAVSDRFSPRTLMLASNVLRAVLTIIIAAIIFTGVIQLWHLYALSIAFGFVDAFFYPAYFSVTPRIVLEEHLTASNALLRGTNRLMMPLGAAAAGLIIQAGSFATAFAIDALTFIFSAAMIYFMVEERRAAGKDAAGKDEPRQAEKFHLKELFRSIGEGLRYSWSHPLVRALLFFISAVEFSFAGLSTVGLAMISKTKFPGTDPESIGAAAFAAMQAAFSCGMLIGMFLAGMVTLPKQRGRVIIGMIALAGVGFTVLGFATDIVSAALVLVVTGIGGGLSNILVMGWLQARTDVRILGRVMSLLTFSMSVLEPLSFALAGIMADFNVTILFVIGGAIMLVASLLSITNHAIRTSE